MEETERLLLDIATRMPHGSETEEMQATIARRVTSCLEVLWIMAILEMLILWRLW
jgi:hypothetical protein